MNKQQLHDRIEQSTPEVSDRFHHAVCGKLNEIAAQERTTQMTKQNQHHASFKRRGLAIALAATLLVGTAALAATRWHLFDNLTFMFGDSTPVHADQIIQSNLAHETINGVDIDIREAGYDGKTLFIRYTYKMNDVDTPLGMYRNGEAGEGISEEDMNLLADHRVGWWIDHLWVDGKCVDMPNSSGGTTSGSENPGEIVQTEYWRLDNEGVALSGKVKISLPIGECQSLEDYRKSEHPEKYGADGKLIEPDKGLVSFTLDTTGVEKLVRTEHPNGQVKTDMVTAQVSEACYSPLMTYITLKLEVDPQAMAAYLAENGEGFMDENGQMLWPYGGMDVFDDWICSLELVDGKGKQLFPDRYGNNGYGNDWAEYNYPYIAELPDELYMAPIVGGEADMTQAVKVK